MLAYKLLRKRKNGSLASLFIGKSTIIPMGKWLKAKAIPTKGYAYRPGFHCCIEPKAPHLKERKDRAWFLVEIDDFYKFKRPKSQGGYWLIAYKMKVLKQV